MRIKTLIAVTLGLGAFAALAQDGPGRPPGHGHFPAPPLMVALDTNKDGELDAAEIANASAALLTLDTNGDGKLSADELRPPSPGGTNQSQFGPASGRKPPVSPLMAALDTNGDGELDATEIANASAALLKLDTNGDGKLSKDELRPKGPRPPGGSEDSNSRQGPGGPGGPGDGSGPDGPGGPPPPDNQ